MILHKTGSSTPVGTNPNIEKSQFHPFFSRKDSTPVILTITATIIVITNFPLITIDAENFSEANPLVTPIHIQPE
jgi:ubiquinol-cytochrome c reductase cytochrome b subunit